MRQTLKSERAAQVGAFAFEQGVGDAAVAVGLDPAVDDAARGIEIHLLGGVTDHRAGREHRREAIVDAEGDLLPVEVERVLEIGRILVAVAKRAVQEPAPAAVHELGIGACAASQRQGPGSRDADRAVGFVHAGETGSADAPAQRGDARRQRRELARRELGRHRALRRDLLGCGPAQCEAEAVDVEPQAETRVAGAQQLVRGVDELARLLEHAEYVIGAGRPGSRCARARERVEACLVGARRRGFERVELRQDPGIREIRARLGAERRAAQHEECTDGDGARYAGRAPPIAANPDR